MSDSIGHYPEIVLLSQNFPGFHYGGCVHRTHVPGIPTGVLAKRPGPPDHAAVLTNVGSVDCIPSAGGLPRQIGRGHVQVGLPMETGSRTGID